MARVRGLQYIFSGIGIPAASSVVQVLCTDLACSLPRGVSSGSAAGEAFQTEGRENIYDNERPQTSSPSVYILAQCLLVEINECSIRIQNTYSSHALVPYFSSATLSASFDVDESIIHSAT